ncbi:DUF6124 family protein [Pseudomonas carnis]|uniref:DUF6124 family protein n=1 Tax=Pseudomonas carnis TaxID=2487355 RepID=UPI001BC918FF|nr:DUF6124 family protein [Pseudomonas carnis]
MHNNTRSSSIDQSASSVDAAVERPIDNLFLVNPPLDPENLLSNAAENLGSANEMAATLAFDLDDSQRAIALGIQQLIELSSLPVDRAQEQVAPVTASVKA